MKTNLWIILFSISLITNASLITASNADEGDSTKTKIFNAFGDAKKAIAAELERQAQAKRAEDARVEVTRVNEEEKKNPRVQDSKFVVNQTLPNDTKWAWVKITKDQFKEDVFVKAIDGNLSKLIYLRRGEGKYQIDIYTSNNPKQYEGNYFALTKFELTNLDKRDLSFLLPSENVESDDPRIVQIANRLVADLDNDVDKVKAIHDYVANKVTYDDEGLRTKSYLTQPTDASSVLTRPLTVCAGYANLFAAIVRAAHIRVSVIFGNALIADGFGLHAWNEVFVENEWKIVDVTWDDMNPTRYDYFFPTAEDFAKDHQNREVQISF